ncbi:fatty acyl-AMP ligase [Mycolicibacterium parafortuitum]|uniref:Long-chain-fatty-acid--CoA ligase [Rhodococcus jostii RHA1] n=1 Tax=Mycolicibacterium parafortuitum TaxID=39692 RepID=A0A375YNY7_MYCPF|nr:fatty acyl-AMP ligase [Mycolicibacterium parafortuitum]ORB25819.1 fatty-acid--CoA ligase [Mycolicibacterium parafortuitum]SRX82803.1 long-chain-fatty-acid--CoA ligase [Rhodococcus jostii RHA1] [Mycolicibacterium parafortuitum]
MSPELRLDDYLDREGNIAIPAGTTLTSFLGRNAVEFGDTPAYRYLDFDHDRVVELTWSQLRARLDAVANRLRQVTQPGDRVAILTPQGVEYVVGFFAAIEAGTIAVPLFAPELPGHAERLHAVLADAQPSVVLTTSSAAEAVRDFLRVLPRDRRPRMIAVDAVPDSVGIGFERAPLQTDDIAYLQYTSGSTRTPAGVEITHRSACTNVVQMVLSVGLDRDINSVSWLPLFHDMGLLMIMFPALAGGYLTLMSPVAFVRRPYRWIKELGATDRPMFAAAPNFAFALAAQRGLPPAGESLDLSNVAGLINGSEPVSVAAVEAFNAAFAPYGLQPTVIKPSYGMAEATLFVSTTPPEAQLKAVHVDRKQLTAGRAVPVDPDHPDATVQVSCGIVARSQWAVIVDPATESELPDGCVGEIWLHGDNIGHGYWQRPEETELTFRNKLQSRLARGSHADRSADSAQWLRTGDMGVYIDGELYITGRIKDLIIVDGRNHYPQDIEATAADASPSVRAGFVAAFSVPGEEREEVVIVAERAPGAGRAEAAPIQEALRAAVSRKHAVPVREVKLVAAGVIPRTTSGKLARRACRAEYLDGTL